MKKSGFLTAIALTIVLLFSSCEKTPDLDQLDGKSIVRTSYDKDANFGAMKNYFINDTVYAITGTGKSGYEKWDYEKNSSAKTLIDKVKSNLNTLGYTQVSDTLSCDMALQITFIKNTTYFVDYPDYYWWDYWNYNNYYWYWGYNLYYPYYPYAVAYGYSTGSTVIDMINFDAPLKNDTKTGKKSRPVAWNTIIDRTLTSNGTYNLERVTEGIDQAFKQSPYLKKQ